MSTKAKATLATTVLGTIGIVYFVHYQQVADKAVCQSSDSEGTASLTIEQAMHQGVIRDMEQQRIKRERQVDFEMQRQLEEEYRKIQTVSDSTDK
jgi:protein PET117